MWTWLKQCACFWWGGHKPPTMRRSLHVDLLCTRCGRVLDWAVPLPPAEDSLGQRLRARGYADVPRGTRRIVEQAPSSTTDNPSDGFLIGLGAGIALDRMSSFPAVSEAPVQSGGGEFSGGGASSSWDSGSSSSSDSGGSSGGGDSGGGGGGE